MPATTVATFTPQDPTRPIALPSSAQPHPIRQGPIARAVTIVILLAGCVVFLYPFLWMISFSFRPVVEVGSMGLWSNRFNIDNYKAVFTKIPIGRAFLNSLIVSGSITACVVFFGSLVGYALSRLNFRGRGTLLTVILLTMVIPFQITMIPLYTLIVNLRLTDNYLGLILPYAIGPFAILLFRQFFLDLPQDLVDAARVDGCGEFRILFRIFYPLSLPVIVTVAILTFMNTWNEALWPMLIIRDRSLMPMPELVALFSVGGEAEGQQGIQIASAVLLALPLLAAYAFFQRYFIESLASTGLKN